MKDEELKKLILKKQFLIDCFLLTSALEAGDDSEQFIKHAVTSYYLQSLVLELFIKILYELDFGKQAPFTHNVLKIFNSLKENTRVFVLSGYNEARKRKEAIFEKIDKPVTFPPLQDVLSSNESFVKNFKYDGMASKSNYSVDSGFYNYLMQRIREDMEK